MILCIHCGETFPNDDPRPCVEGETHTTNDAQAEIARLTQRAEEAEAERDAIAAAAFEAAAQVCEEYPRAAPDENEWPHYDDQISHSQACIRTLTPADALSALAARDAAKVAEGRKLGMREAAEIAKARYEDSGEGAGILNAILAAIQREGGK